MAHARFCSHVVQLTTHAPNSISGRCSPRQAHAPDSISGGCWPRQTLGFVANPFQRTTWARCGRSHPLLLTTVGLSSWRPSLVMKQNSVVFEGKNNCLASEGLHEDSPTVPSCPLVQASPLRRPMVWARGGRSQHLMKTAQLCHRVLRSRHLPFGGRQCGPDVGVHTLYYSQQLGCLHEDLHWQDHLHLWGKRTM